MKKVARSRQIAQKTIFATFKILKEAGGEMRGKEVVDRIRETLDFDEYESHRYEKTGYVRWESILSFYTIDCMKAGFMRKKNGIWYLTQEGEQAIALGPEKLLDTATKKYREWDAKKKETADKEYLDDVEEEEADDSTQKQEALIEQYETSALEGVRDYILAKNPYEFQDLVAGLLYAMGYFTPFVAQKGPDGGVDIIAYTDPLGVKSPRVLVQVKHKPLTKISTGEIQQLSGTMKRASDVGIFVTSGEFTSNSIKEAREANQHIELIDFERLVSLWKAFYPKMDDDTKKLLPLHPIYFLGSND